MQYLAEEIILNHIQEANIKFKHIFNALGIIESVPMRCSKKAIVEESKSCNCMEEAKLIVNFYGIKTLHLNTCPL